jgi:hypothetical protein
MMIWWWFLTTLNEWPAPISRRILLTMSWVLRNGRLSTLSNLKRMFNLCMTYLEPKYFCPDFAIPSRGCSWCLRGIYFLRNLRVEGQAWSWVVSLHTDMINWFRHPIPPGKCRESITNPGYFYSYDCQLNSSFMGSNRYHELESSTWE